MSAITKLSLPEPAQPDAGVLRPSARFLCTLNGVGKFTDLPALKALLERFDFLEIGVAYRHPGESDRPCYSSEEFIRNLANDPAMDGRLALHICGEGAVESYLDGYGPAARLAKLCKRVQVNWNDLSDVEIERDLERIPWAADNDQQDRGKQETLIVPIPDEKSPFVKVLAGNRKIAFAYDKSFGNGEIPEIRHPAIAGHVTVYTGGLRQENLRTEIPRILQAAQGQIFGIDAESGVRAAHGCLCVLKAEKFLLEVEGLGLREGFYRPHAEKFDSLVV